MTFQATLVAGREMEFGINSSRGCLMIIPCTTPIRDLT